MTCENTMVYLVGAGPGDAGLITVRGRELLERADIVVYDYLANAELLDAVPEGAERLYVGKKGFAPHAVQGDINTLLVDKARELQARGGGALVRLKGGDPFVFGRGGEEALALAQAGIPFQVVPGVTAGVAAPAYAGIPLTHRNFSSSVTLITGHENPDKPGSVHNWKALAAGANTLVFVKGKGIVIREPSVVAVDQKYNPPRVVAVGTEAKEMIGRTPGSITAVRPLKDGVIADFDITADMLKAFIKKVTKNSPLARVRVMICIPSGVTGVERNAVCRYRCGSPRLRAHRKHGRRHRRRHERSCRYLPGRRCYLELRKSRGRQF